MGADEKEQKRQFHENQRNEPELRLKGKYRLIYPLLHANIPEEEMTDQDKEIKLEIDQKIADYKKMLDVAKDLFEFFNSGKKIKDGGTMQEAKNEKGKDNRPPWRGTGAGHSM